MKKIVFFHSSASIYGSDRMLKHIVSRFVNTYEVVVVLAEGGVLANELEGYGCRVVVLDLCVVRRKEIPVNPVRLVRSYFSIKNFLKEENPDLVYENTSVMPLVGLVSKRLRLRSICHVREVYFEWRWFWRIYEAYLLWSHEKLIAISKVVMNQFSRKEKLVLIYDGVELNTGSDFEKRKNPLIGFVGRISWKKGVDLFLKAFSLVLKEYKNTKVFLRGSYYRTDYLYMKYLNGLMRDEGISSSVVFQGEKSSDVYNLLDVVVVSTRGVEPLGLVVMEAMSLGKVVIAPNVGGPSELISDGVTGYLYEAESILSLSKAMMFVLDNWEKSQKVGIKASRRAAREFRVENSMKNIEKVVRSLV